MRAHANILSASVVPSPPSRIGRYEIKSPIGRGGMGNLYLANDPSTGRLVAIKLLDATLNSAEFRQRFVREARALAAVNHPHIVNIYDTGEYEGAPYIVMEYIRGETLAEIIQRRAPIPLAQRVQWMAELCAGLSQAHEARVIHRDIKPANLIVDQQGRLKILDFGIARVDLNATTVGMPLTQVNMAIGTPGYMSPEQLEGGEVDHRSDLFSVGAVCYELFTYVEAFAGRNTMEVERQVAACRPQPMTAVAPGVDPELSEIVLRALKKEPNKRYQDASTFERALERFRARLESAGEAASPRSTPPPPTTGRAKSRELRAAAAYQRALSAYQSGAIDVARRFAVEALAEDPSHKEARALLAGFDRGPQRPVPQTAVPAPSLATAVSTSIESTMIVERGAIQLPDVTRTSDDPGQSISDARTIIVQPSSSRRNDDRTAAVERPDRGRGGTAAGRAKHSAGDRLGAWLASVRAAARSMAQGSRAGMLLLAGAVGLAVLLVLAIWLLPGLFSSSGPLLTITKPVNGTLVTDGGLKCGSAGSDCSATVQEGDTVEFIPRADDGYVFVGYRDDCAPSGRVRMNGPRTCGALFEKASGSEVAGQSQSMTIAPVPVGGTIESVDIKCGSQGSACSASYPQGEMAVLKAIADDGYTFMGFTGDCAGVGQAQMTIARTCGARFELTSKLSTVAARNAGGPPVVVATPQLGEAGRPESARGPASPPAVTTPTSAAPTGAAGGGTSPPATGQAAAGPSPPPVGAPSGEPAKPPQTDEEFARDRIKELLARWCEAYVAIDPAAVQQVYPKVNMDALKLQLTRSRYRAVQCSTGDLKYGTLDAAAGKATLQTDVTWVFEHTVPKKEESKLVGTFTIVRSNVRTPWLIENVAFRAK